MIQYVTVIMQRPDRRHGTGLAGLKSFQRMSVKCSYTRDDIKTILLESQQNLSLSFLKKTFHSVAKILMRLPPLTQKYPRILYRRNYYNFSILVTFLVYGISHSYAILQLCTATDRCLTSQQPQKN